MKTYRHIIVGIDFSPASRAALRTALRFAAFNGTPVTAVHAIDPKLAGAIKQAHQCTDEEVFKHIGESMHTFLNQSDAGTQLVKTEMDVGNPFLSIVAASQRHNADLIILGTRGTDHGPNEIGVVAARCMRKAPADVLLVREGMTTPFKHITACMDFSETSAKAVCAARHVAEHEKSKLDCLFVYQSALALSLDYGGFIPPLPAGDGEGAAAWKKDMDAFLDPLFRTAAGLEWRSVIMERVNIREAIVEHIKSTGTDLVVMGTRGKTDLRTLLMGTTAEKVLTHAPCSILAVKPDDFEYPAADKGWLPQATAPLA